MHDRRQTQRAKPLAALRKPLRMAVNLGKRLERGTLWRQQMMIDPLEMLAIDEKAGSREKMVDVGHPPGDRILDRYHGQRGARLWRRHLGEEARNRKDGGGLIREVAAACEEMATGMAA